MTGYDVAFIGTGPEPDNPVWGESAAMAYRHADGYRQLEDCSLVACADLVQENAAAFAAEFDIDAERVYEDYGQMLQSVEPDVVSVCTPVPTHADIVVDVAESGVVDAVHCEKPMADTWRGSREMAAACADADVLLTFNHQRRFGDPVGRIRDLLDDGVVGNLRKLEFATKNFYDSGSHFVDLCHYFNDERDVDWVMGQVDYRTENVRYGVHNENQSIVHWQYENDVTGAAYCGFGDDLLDCQLRLTGTEGVVELRPSTGGTVRYKRDGASLWTDIEPEGHGSNIPGAVASVVRALETGERSMLCAENALRATETLFAGYESARRRGRVDLPLQIDDNPLVALVESGDLAPGPAED